MSVKGSTAIDFSEIAEPAGVAAAGPEATGAAPCSGFACFESASLPTNSAVSATATTAKPAASRTRRRCGLGCAAEPVPADVPAATAGIVPGLELVQKQLLCKWRNSGDTNENSR